MKLNLSSHLWVLGSFKERYVPEGYYKDMELEEKLQIMSEIGGFTGLVIYYPTFPLPNDPDKVMNLLRKYELGIGLVAVENFTDRKWKHGGLCTNEKKVREDCIKLCKKP